MKKPKSPPLFTTEGSSDPFLDLATVSKSSPFSSWIEDSNYQWIPSIPKPNNDKATWEFTNYQTGDGYWVNQDTNQPI